MKIAFLTTRLERPSYRFRVGQFLPFLERHGVACFPLLIPPQGPARVRLLLSLRRYDAVVIQKRLFGAFDRAILSRAARRIVFDLDDAVMRREGDADGRAAGGARSRRFRAMARMSDLVLAGNDELRREAAAHAARVFCFPTVVDTDRYCPAPRSPGAGEPAPRNPGAGGPAPRSPGAGEPAPRSPGAGGPVIGWSGSRGTNAYLGALLPVLDRLAARVPFTLRVVSDTQEGIGLTAHPNVRAEFSRWDAASEREEFQGFDIGLMPLPDTPWARGKCALKALVYMACGVPAVCSPVGVVSTIITNGRNGFLPADDTEWGAVLERLLLDEALRRRVAAAARTTVEERFSLAAHAPRLLAILRDLCGEGAP